MVLTLFKMQQQLSMLASPDAPQKVCLPVPTRCVLRSWCHVQHLSNLLAAPVPEVAAAALQTFQVLVRKTHHTSVRWTPPAGLSQRLLSLSKGWGGKEEVRKYCLCCLL